MHVEPAGPFRAKRLQGFLQSQFVKSGRPEIGSDPMYVAANSVGESLQPVNSIRGGIGPRGFNGMLQIFEPKHQAGHALSDLIVKLTRNPPPLIFFSNGKTPQ